MKARDAQKLRNMLLILGFIIMAVAFLYDAVWMIGVIVSLSCIIPDYLYNKCPHCGKRLGRNEADFCHHCGGKID